MPDLIKSTKSQNFPDFEHIFIDGASTDGTQEYIRENYKEAVFVSEKDNGIYDALNKGLKLANSEIIGFLHSDDLFFSENTLKKIIDCFNAPDSPDIVYGDLVFVSRSDVHKIVRYWKSNYYKQGDLKKGWMPPHPTLFMRRRVYEKHGLFNTALRCSADYDYILKVFNDPSLRIRYIPELLVKMRTGGKSTGGIKNILNKMKEDYRVLKNHNLSFPFLILLQKNMYKIPQLFSNPM